MAQIFTALLLTSGIGTALALILTLLKPITRKVFSGGWHYYMWLVVLLVMVLPIRLNLPEKPVTTPPISETVTITDNQVEITETPIIIETQPEQIIQEQTTQPEKVSTVQVIKDFLSGKVLLFSLIWLMGAVLLFLIKIISYLIFLIKIHRHSELISCPEVKAYTNRKIRTRVSDTICSPLMIGIIRPTLLLPKTNITPEQLHNVLAHEMTHLKRNDILYKWFVSIVKCVHWFNPAIYFISKQINIDCEISCDLAVIKEMDEQEKKKYVETILSLITPCNKKSIPLTTGMTGNKRALKRRFAMIRKKEKTGKLIHIFSITMSVVFLISTLFVSGVLATEFLKVEDNGTLFETGVEHNSNNKEDTIIGFNDTVYRGEKWEYDFGVPKNETIIVLPQDKEQPKVSENGYVGKMEKPEKPHNVILLSDELSTNSNNSTEMQNNIANNSSLVNNITKKIKSSEVSSELYGGFEQVVIKNATAQGIENILMQNGITKSHNNTADLSKNYIVNEYTYEDSLKYDYSGVKCDNNGNISMYFAVNSDNLVDIQFYDTETREEVGQYGILANNENAYTFIGFDPNKTYDISIQGKTKDTWKIEGEHIIY